MNIPYKIFDVIPTDPLPLKKYFKNSKASYKFGTRG